MTSDKETAVFRAEFGQNFPDIADLAAAVSFSSTLTFLQKIEVLCMSIDFLRLLL